MLSEIENIRRCRVAPFRLGWPLRWARFFCRKTSGGRRESYENLHELARQDTEDNARNVFLVNGTGLISSTTLSAFARSARDWRSAVPRSEKQRQRKEEPRMSVDVSDERNVASRPEIAVEDRQQEDGCPGNDRASQNREQRFLLRERVNLEQRPDSKPECPKGYA